jgi:nucleoside 2-deoxyribosyltransferase
MNKLYLASPLGFSPENASYLNQVKAALTARGFEIFDPWEQNQFADKIAGAFQQRDFDTRVRAFGEVARLIGACNEEGIRRSDVLLAVLDGAEVDSGTASEVGFGSALGKRCYGLRTDLRDSGDFIGVPVNLQVLHFIERSGGTLYRTIAEMAAAIAVLRQEGP